MSELGSGSGSSFPSALDTDTTQEVNSPNASKTKARAEVVNDHGAAIVAIQTELGTDPAGTKTDVKTYLQTEHNTDGTHNIPATSLLTDSIPIRDSSRGLVVTANVTNPTYQVDIDADEIMLHNSTPTPFRATSINLTVDISTSGANGLDTGSEAASTNYYLWVIYNPTTTTTAGIISLSKTAPTMPSGYTYKALVGEFFNDSGSDISYINWWNGIYFLDGDVADTAASGPTSLDLGNLTIGDVGIVNATLSAGSGLTTGTLRLFVSKASGTAVINMHDSNTSATQTAYFDTIGQSVTVSAIFRVTTGGTFVLASALLADGAILTGYDNQIYVKFVKKQ